MFKKDLSDSAIAFIDLVWPIIKPHFGNCKIRQVETVSTVPFCKELDQYAGIDAWVLNDKKGMRGLASRVQWPDDTWSKQKINDFLEKPYNSFTVRRSRKSGRITEFSKRYFAIENNWLYPYYTLQAYTSKRGNKGNVLSIAWCNTKDLIRYIKDGRPSEEFDIHEVTKKGGATFYVVYWDMFTQIYPLEKWDKKKGYIKLMNQNMSFDYFNSKQIEKKVSKEDTFSKKLKLSDFF